MKETKVAHLVYETVDEVDEYGSFVRTKSLLTRYTNPVVNGYFSGYGQFSAPVEVTETPQELANKSGEVIFNKDSREYIFPAKER